MSGHGDGVENIAEVFKCFICMEWPKDASMCPHCSKLCCFGCIQRWLIEQRPNCPHCRSSLMVHELVKCRWAEDIYMQVDKVRTEVRHHRPEVKERERCPQHHEDLTVYCATCTKCICHKCALWGGEHASHTFEEVDRIYKKHKGVIQSERNKLWKRFLEITELVQKVERSMDRVRADKQEQSRQIHESVDHIVNRLETQLKTKLQKLVESRNILSRKAEDINGLLQELDRKMKSTTRSELINQGYEIQKKLMPLIQQVQQTTSTRDFETLPDVGSFTNEIVPQYDTATFKIKHFSRLRQRGDPVYSESLRVSGLTWRLKVYPFGNAPTKGNYLSVFLELTQGFHKTSQYQYRIEMLYQGGGGHDAKKNVVREFTSDFAVGECWGYNRFYRLDSLASDGFIDQATDTVCLRYSVHAPTYHLKCRDLSMYCANLEKKNAILHRTIAQLEEKLGTELGKKKGDTSGHRSSHSRQSQDIQEENRERQHRANDSSQQHQQKHSKQTSTTKRRHSRESEMRSKTSSSTVAGSESLSQEHYIEHNHDAKNVDDEPGSFNALSLPPQSSPSDHSTHSNRTNDLNYKSKNSKESHDKRKQHNEAAESGGGISRTHCKQENASSAKEASADTARQDREATPLAASANPKIVVGESDDGEISSGNSTPVPKPGYESFEIDIGVSPATSTSTLTTVGIRSPECNGHGDVNDHHYRHSAKPQPPSTDGDMDRVVPKEYRDKYYSKQRHSYNLQPPSHDPKFKQRNSSEFQSLKELEETSSFVRSPSEQPYEFSISPAQISVHELSQVESFSLGSKKTRTSCGDLYNQENSPPSPRTFLSQSVMDLNGQEEALTQFSERSNLSRMSSEPYLGPPGLQSTVCTAIYENQYPPSNYRYSSGLHYSQSMAPPSGRHGNRSRHPKNRVPGRRHSGESSHHLVAGDKSNSTSSLSQPRRGDEV